MKNCIITSCSISGKGIVSHKEIRAGEIVLECRGVIQNGNACSEFAIQVDKTSYIELNGKDGKYINHSCEPNCYIDFYQVDKGKITFRALRDIPTGEEITFNYNTTEYDMHYWKCSFGCKCGSKNCLDEVKGFRYIPNQNRENIKLLLSPYLGTLYSKEKTDKRKFG